MDTQEASEKEVNKKGRIKQAKGFRKCFRSWGEENERRMANNVIQEMRLYNGYLVCLDFCVDLPRNSARNG